jgi:hypothetical protein
MSVHGHQAIRFATAAGVLNSRSALDNTETEARGRSRRSDNSGWSRLTPGPVPGIEQTDYHGVTLFQ